MIQAKTENEMSEIKSFLGTGWTFPPTFIKDGKNGILMSEGEKGIRESLHVLLSTTMGERHMDPGFGVNLAEVLFETAHTHPRNLY